MSDQTETKTETSGGLGELAKEIDTAVEAVTARIASGSVFNEDAEGDEPDEHDEPADDASADEPQDAEPAEKPAEGRDDKGRFAPKPPSSKSLERAVRLGLTLDEAKEFPTDALLAATCDRIEGVQKKTGERAGKPEGDDVEAQPDGDPLDAIPDLSPEEFDEKLVNGFKALKGLVKSLREENTALRDGKSKDFIATQLQALKNVTKGDQTKESAVAKKFEALKAGYKATGENLSDVTVFNEAARLVLGDDVDAARASRESAARKRSGQRLMRPGGARVEVKPDPASEVAAMIDTKFFRH